MRLTIFLVAPSNGSSAGLSRGNSFWSSLLTNSGVSWDNLTRSPTFFNFLAFKRSGDGPCQCSIFNLISSSTRFNFPLQWASLHHLDKPFSIFGRVFGRCNPHKWQVQHTSGYWDKIADFANETKPPFIRTRQNRRSVKIKIAESVSAESTLNKNEQLIQLHSVMNASELNLERILKTTWISLTPAYQLEAIKLMKFACIHFRPAILSIGI